MRPAAVHCRRAAARAAAALLLASALASPALAQWQWRGPDGRVTASDRPPPPQVPERDILRRPPADPRRSPPAPPRAAAEAASAASAPAVAASAAPTALDRAVDQRRRAAEAAAAAKAKADDERNRAIRAANCQAARRQLAQLDSGMRIATTNDRGEREFLDDRARAEQAARARDAMASECR